MLHTSGANAGLLETLFRYSVRFLVIGGLAVQHYAPEREADDLDLLIDPHLENMKKLCFALRSAGFTKLPDPEKLARSRVQIRTHPLYEVDLLTPDENFYFVAAMSRSEACTVNGHVVRVASREDLIQLKRAGRSVDQRDIALLQRSRE